MRPVFCAPEVDHAVQAGKGGAVALIPMSIKLLLGEHVTTYLANNSQTPDRSRGTLVASIDLLHRKRRPWRIGFSRRMMRFAKSS
jgi:hypothetical protein